MSQNSPPSQKSTQSWTTDLSTPLSTWKKIVIFFGLLALIVPGVLLYLYWSKKLVSTLVSDGEKLAIYEESGRKASPKTTRYYYNPSAVSTIHGYTTKTRSLPLLFLGLLILIVGVNMLINGSIIGIIVAAGILLIFFLYTKKVSMLAINSEPRDTVSGSGSGGGSIFQLILLPIVYLVRFFTDSTDEAVPLVKRVNEVSLKQSGTISLCKNTSVVFGGVDEDARQAVQQLEDNFKLYLDE